MKLLSLLFSFFLSIFVIAYSYNFIETLKFKQKRKSYTIKKNNALSKEENRKKAVKRLRKLEKERIDEFYRKSNKSNKNKTVFDPHKLERMIKDENL